MQPISRQEPVEFRFAKSAKARPRSVVWSAILYWALAVLFGLNFYRTGFGLVSVLMYLLNIAAFILILSIVVRVGRLLQKDGERFWAVTLGDASLTLHQNRHPDRIIRYTDISNVTVTYDQNLGYDRMVLTLMLPNGDIATTGKSFCPGETMEAAAAAIRERVHAATGRAAGSPGEDRALRLSQFADVARKSRYTLPIIAALTVAAILFIPRVMHGPSSEELRRKGRAGIAVVEKKYAHPFSERHIRFVYRQTDGEEVSLMARILPIAFDLVQEGERIPIHFIPGKPAYANPDSTPPYPSPAYTAVSYCLALLCAAYLTAPFWLRRHIAFARRRVYLLKPGELEEDRIHGKHH